MTSEHGLARNGCSFSRKSRRVALRDPAVAGSARSATLSQKALMEFLLSPLAHVGRAGGVGLPVRD